MKLTETELNAYDNIIIAFSGGKDSTACLLDLLSTGADKEKIELWHHDIDGRESEKFMDWAVTSDYCNKFALAFGVPLYYSWKVGGFSREMLRKNTPTAPTKFETPEGIRQSGGTSGKLGTRRKFPQVSGDLSVRWCSAYLKVDVCSTSIRNQERFINKKILLVSGERAEESPGRAKYKTFEPDRADNRNSKNRSRLVDRYRPIHKWTEGNVWEIIKRFKIRVHPAYYIGWGRVSCASCIFGSSSQWASLNSIDPEHVNKIIEREEEFGVTINRKKSIKELLLSGIPYDSMSGEDIKDALSKKYTKKIIMKSWVLPSGAFGESCGPT